MINWRSGSVLIPAQFGNFQEHTRIIPNYNFFGYRIRGLGLNQVWIHDHNPCPEPTPLPSLTVDPHYEIADLIIPQCREIIA